MSSQAVIVLVTIDTECDKGPGWRIQRPMRFTSVTEGIPERLTPLFRRHGIVPTYLLSPEIIQDAESVAVLAGVPDCELGTHLHGEFVAPEAVMDAPRTSTPQASYAPELEREKLRNLTRLFEEAFGYRPTSFRAGRFGMSRFTLPFLAELGYLVDSSVAPFRTPTFDGGLRCNYWGAPWQPYWPSARDPRRRGGLPILEVPVSILSRDLAAWPAWVLRRMSDRSIWTKRVLPKMGLRAKAGWLRPFRGTAEQMIQLAQDMVRLGARDGRPVVLNVMFHSNEIIPAASPYPQTEPEVAQMLADLESLFAFLSDRYDVTSCGMSRLHDVFMPEAAARVRSS